MLYSFSKFGNVQALTHNNLQLDQSPNKWNYVFKVCFCIQSISIIALINVLVKTMW